jgi:hypothetical protein
LQNPLDQLALLGLVRGELFEHRDRCAAMGDSED